MRNEPMHAYSLHQRPFQEKRTIYYLFTQEYGVLHGVAKKGLPQFVPLSLFATGKKSLKTLSQVTIAESVPNLKGHQQFAALYVNEITLKLLPVEDSVPNVYKQYQKTITLLQQSLSMSELKLVLRLYEQVLFSEMGYSIDLEQDCLQNEINSSAWYCFIADSGWKPVEMDEISHGVKQNPEFNKLSLKPFSGKHIINMRKGINSTTLDSWSAIHRQLIDYLFDYQPLQSRVLWQQFYRYQ